MEKSREVLPDGTETEGKAFQEVEMTGTKERNLRGAPGDHPAVSAFAVGEKSLLNAFWNVVIQYGLHYAARAAPAILT